MKTTLRAISQPLVDTNKFAKFQSAEMQRCISEYTQKRFKLRTCEIKSTWKEEKTDAGKEILVLAMTHRPTGVQFQDYVVGRARDYTKREKSELRKKTIKRWLFFIEKVVVDYLRAFLLCTPAGGGVYGSNYSMEDLTHGSNTAKVCLRLATSLFRQDKTSRNSSNHRRSRRVGSRTS